MVSTCMQDRTPERRAREVPDARCNQEASSEVIRGHQRSSEAISASSRGTVTFRACTLAAGMPT